MARWMARQGQLLALRSYLVRLRDDPQRAATKHVSFPVPLKNSLSPLYVQSWRFDRFASSPWIKYPHQDGFWRFESRCGFMYKLYPERKELLIVEDYPRLFNPRGFFPLNLMFWRGENTWMVVILMKVVK